MTDPALAYDEQDREMLDELLDARSTVSKYIAEEPIGQAIVEVASIMDDGSGPIALAGLSLIASEADGQGSLSEEELAARRKSLHVLSVTLENIIPLIQQLADRCKAESEL